jgi:hypothetical protein
MGGKGWTGRAGRMVCHVANERRRLPGKREPGHRFLQTEARRGKTCRGNKDHDLALAPTSGVSRWWPAAAFGASLFATTSTVCWNRCPSSRDVATRRQSGSRSLIAALPDGLFRGSSASLAASRHAAAGPWSHQLPGRRLSSRRSRCCDPSVRTTRNADHAYGCRSDNPLNAASASGASRRPAVPARPCRIAASDADEPRSSAGRRWRSSPAHLAFPAFVIASRESSADPGAGRTASLRDRPIPARRTRRAGRRPRARSGPRGSPGRT